MCVEELHLGCRSEGGAELVPKEVLPGCGGVPLRRGDIQDLMTCVRVFSVVCAISIAALTLRSIQVMAAVRSPQHPQSSEMQPPRCCKPRVPTGPAAGSGGPSQRSTEASLAAAWCAATRCCAAAEGGFQNQRRSMRHQRRPPVAVSCRVVGARAAEPQCSSRTIWLWRP